MTRSLPRTANPPPASRPLVHIPLYCVANSTAHSIQYMLELTCACLDSYFAHGNDCDVLVTTNDQRPYEVLSAYRRQSGHRFELRQVSREALRRVFKTDSRGLDNVKCCGALFSKFYPLLAGVHDRILHIDFDIIFMGKVDFERIFLSNLTLVRPSPVFRKRADAVDSQLRAWSPPAEGLSFFRVEPCSILYRWLNAGVFSAQAGGFELIRDETEYYLQKLDVAIATGINEYCDEAILNALALREPDSVALLPDYNFNFLAYRLIHDSRWLQTCQILHFHGVKPHVLRATASTGHAPSGLRSGEVRLSKDLCLRENTDERLPPLAGNEAFHLAALTWFLHLHAAARSLSCEFPTLKAVPLHVAQREHARLTATLEPMSLASSSGSA